MKSALSAQVSVIRQAVLSSFPAGTTVTDPAGGCVLWIEMPNGCDSMRLYRKAIEQGIIIAPGPLFSMTGKFNNCLRLNAGIWNDTIKQAVSTLGTLAVTL